MVGLARYLSLCLFFLHFQTLKADSLPAVGTEATLGTLEGLSIRAKVQSPSNEATPLQIICLFEYTDNDIYTSPPALPKEMNGLVHVDEALSGLLTEIRKSKKFTGKFLETLLLTPHDTPILAKQLLLIGLGNKKEFSPALMRLVGVVGMREALRLKVAAYAHASDLKDAGVDSPTAQVAGLVVEGAIEALHTQMWLVQQGASEPITVKKITLLTGQAYHEASKEGIRQTLAAQEKGK